MESVTKSLIKQMDAIQSKIDDNSKKIQSLDAKVKQQIKSQQATKSEMLIELKKKKKYMIQNDQLQVQLNKLMTTAVNMDSIPIMKMKADNDQFILETDKLQGEISEGADHKYYRSRKEKEGDDSDPNIIDHSKITTQRKSMRLRGKDPGPWAEGLTHLEQKERSIGQEGDEDIEAFYRMGMKKLKKRKSKKAKKRKSKKSKRKSKKKTRKY